MHKKLNSIWWSQILTNFHSNRLLPILQDDPQAHEKFLKFTRAYEVLKEPETRKHYDLYGDTGSDLNDDKHYHSYSYYRDDFGIYDDDPIIVTLSRSDYGMNNNLIL